MPAFVKCVIIDAPVSAVFHFHTREDALSMLTPAFPRVRLISRTGGIETGARVELRVGVFRWIALHTAYEQDRLFVDEQINGPFAKWVHRHEFEAAGSKTRMTDHIEFELPGGALFNTLFGWTVKIGLRKMFTHRHRVTKAICENRK